MVSDSYKFTGPSGKCFVIIPGHKFEPRIVYSQT